MTPTVAFLVKNGIGFGHIRRALILAEAVDAAGGLRPVVVSQAGSLALYRDRSVSVVNFHIVPGAGAASHPEAAAADSPLPSGLDAQPDPDPPPAVSRERSPAGGPRAGRWVSHHLPVRERERTPPLRLGRRRAHR